RRDTVPKLRRRGRDGTRTRRRVPPSDDEPMQTPTLFHEVEIPAASPDPPSTGPFAAVALEQGIDRTLDYAIPPSLVGSLQVGQRVRVPLGKNNRPTPGYVITIHPTTNYPKI